MRLKLTFLGLLIVLIGVGQVLVLAQDEDVRGAFMTTRPKATGSASGNNKTKSTTRPSHRRPKTTTVTNPPNNAGSTTVTDNPAVLNTARLGLGVTLFMRDSNGLAVRTDPDREFRKGDHVR